MVVDPSWAEPGLGWADLAHAAPAAADHSSLLHSLLGINVDESGCEGAVPMAPARKDA
jgi:hypothetical protein